MRKQKTLDDYNASVSNIKGPIIGQPLEPTAGGEGGADRRRPLASIKAKILIDHPGATIGVLDAEGYLRFKTKDGAEYRTKVQ